ncbi:maleylacetoacetate isomerase [Tateyamaria omphalii]|uniref:maleylacetoacetate isomerase n=1 Tax=Tateyamaria omphalii TaxID=299262 RepID=UPI0016769D28|nr:maleylacetoacetate isomerase [Tateyamaria omphalii]GGX40421.1 maleylacetoacetate isomerase [Tateyamaria omphalii]
MTAPLTLYSYWRSTTSYRVRAALNLKGVPFETVPVDLLAGAQKDADYAEMNPGKGVPMLVLEDGSVLTQSLAILDYIEARWPEPALLPADPLARARVQAAAYTMAVDVHPVNNLRVVTHLGDAYGADTDGVMDWMRHWMIEGFTAFEALVQDDTPFAFGHAPDLADLCLVAQVYNAHRWGVDLTPFPKVQRIEAACLNVPAIAAAHPDQQPDAS